MRNCFLVHNNWFLDQLETSQLLEYVWHALFGGGHGTTVRSADAICSLRGGQTQLFEEFFKLREEKKKSRTCISAQFVTINLIINKPLKTQWPWEKSELLGGMCRGSVGHPTRVISRWGACRVSTGDCGELRLNHNTPSYATGGRNTDSQSASAGSKFMITQMYAAPQKTIASLAWFWGVAFRREPWCLQ